MERKRDFIDDHLCKLYKDQLKRQNSHHTNFEDVVDLMECVSCRDWHTKYRVVFTNLTE